MIILYIIVSLMVGLISGYLLSYLRIKKILTKGTGRFGIIRYNLFTLEIEEVEEAGTFTKVKLISIISNHADAGYYSKKELLSTISFSEWMPTKDIIWYSSNSKNIRDSKIEQILK